METVTESGAGTLAETLARGPLPLAAALAYAKEIASNVGLLHQQGLVHGAISAEAIQLGPEGVTLSTPTELYRSATPAGDLHDFSVLLEEMFKGGGQSRAECGETGPEAIRAAALRLAARCRDRSGGEAPTMRKAAMELRLLSMEMVRFPEETAAPAELPEEPSSAAEPVPSKSDPYVEPRSTGVVCPWCSAPHVHASERHGVMEVLLFWARAKRCHRCHRRYLTILGCHISRRAHA
jgi:serine/threonine protein kinase